MRGRGAYGVHHAQYMGTHATSHIAPLHITACRGEGDYFENFTRCVEHVHMLRNMHAAWRRTFVRGTNPPAITREADSYVRR